MQIKLTSSPRSGIDGIYKWRLQWMPRNDGGTNHQLAIPTITTLCQTAHHFRRRTKSASKLCHARIRLRFRWNWLRQGENCDNPFTGAPLGGAWVNICSILAILDPRSHCMAHSTYLDIAWMTNIERCRCCSSMDHQPTPSFSFRVSLSTGYRWETYFTAGRKDNFEEYWTRVIIRIHCNDDPHRLVWLVFCLSQGTDRIRHISVYLL